MGKLARVRRAVTAMPWAIMPETLGAICELMELRAAGGQFSEEEIQARVSAGPGTGKAAAPTGGVMVLPLYGTIFPRANMMSDISGGTTAETFGAWLDAALADEAVRAIVLDVDSPGGQVQGIPELAAKLLAGRDVKPIVAQVNHYMCSAAYWLGACTSEVIATPSAIVGSIGVLAVHEDSSAADEAAGVKYQTISAGKFKASDNTTGPLDEDAIASRQAMVDEYYNQMTADIARGRGVAVSQVRGGYGEGLALTARAALTAGMVDRIGTLEETLARLATRGNIARLAGSRATLSPALVAAAVHSMGSGTVLALPLSGGAIATGPRNPPPAPSFVALGPSETAGVDGAAPVVMDLTPSRPVEAKGDSMTPEELAALKAANDKLVTEAKRRDEFDSLVATFPAYVVEIMAVKADPSKTALDAATLIGKQQTAALKAAPGISNGAGLDVLPVGTVGLDRAVGRPWGDGRYAALSEKVRGGAIQRTDREYQHARNVALGENLQAIMHVGQGKTADPRLFAPYATASGASANVGADGGFLIQKEFSVDLLESAFTTGEILSRVDTHEVGAGADGLEVVYLDETSRATGSRWGGVQVYRGAEADAATAKKPKLGKWESRLEDIIGLAYLTERLMQDAASIAQVFAQGFSQEFTFVTENEIIRGTGAGQCLGILNADCTVSAAKETGQVTGTIVSENIGKMWMRVHPRSRNRGVWFYNVECENQLDQMQIGTGASGQLVYMPPGGFSGLPYGTLKGRPTIPIEYASGLSTVGDIFFADFMDYKLITKGGLQADESIHVKFINNERTFRWLTRVNGAPKLKSAITPFKATDSNLKLSPFVTLATR